MFSISLLFYESGSWLEIVQMYGKKVVARYVPKVILSGGHHSGTFRSFQVVCRSEPDSDDLYFACLIPHVTSWFQPTQT